MAKFKNKTVVITGGNSGIGFATAREFLANDAKVIITGRNEASIKKAVDDLGRNAFGIVSDASKMDDLNQLRQKIEEHTDHIDVLFVNAGIGKFCPLAYTPESMFADLVDTNFKGAFFTLQKCLPLLRPGSSVIFLSSISAVTAMPNTSVYAATKAALNAVAKTAAIELAPQNIRVNIVSPGPIATSFFGKSGLSPEQLEAFETAMVQRIPLKRMGIPDEIAKTIAFIASDEAHFVTGMDFIVDGGVSINALTQ